MWAEKDVVGWKERRRKHVRDLEDEHETTVSQIEREGWMPFPTVGRASKVHPSTSFWLHPKRCRNLEQRKKRSSSSNMPGNTTGIFSRKTTSFLHVGHSSLQRWRGMGFESTLPCQLQLRDGCRVAKERECAETTTDRSSVSHSRLRFLLSAGGLSPHRYAFQLSVFESRKAEFSFTSDPFSTALNTVSLSSENHTDWSRELSNSSLGSESCLLAKMPPSSWVKRENSDPLTLNEEVFGEKEDKTDSLYSEHIAFVEQAEQRALRRGDVLLHVVNPQEHPESKSANRNGQRDPFPLSEKCLLQIFPAPALVRTVAHFFWKKRRPERPHRKQKRMHGNRQMDRCVRVVNGKRSGRCGGRWRPGRKRMWMLKSGAETFK